MQIHLPCFVILDGYRLNLKLTAADLLFLLHFDNFDKKCLYIIIIYYHFYAVHSLDRHKKLHNQYAHSDGFLSQILAILKDKPLNDNYLYINIHSTVSLDIMNQ